MIYGIGTDLTEVGRIASAYPRDRFRAHVYTAGEQEIIGKNMQRAAGNFAVKEAVVKAFGTGFGKISPVEIEVLREQNGKPCVNLFGAAKEFGEKEKIGQIHVSISNTKEYAVGYVVIEKNCPEG